MLNNVRLRAGGGDGGMADAMVFRLHALVIYLSYAGALMGRKWKLEVGC